MAINSTVVSNALQELLDLSLTLLLIPVELYHSKENAENTQALPGQFTPAGSEGRERPLFPLAAAPQRSEGSSQLEKSGDRGATGDPRRAWGGRSATVFSLQTQDTLPPPPLSTAVTSTGG